MYINLIPCNLAITVYQFQEFFGQFFCFFQIFYINDHIICIQRLLVFLFLYSYPFFSFCLILFARASSAMLERNGEERHPCKPPIWEGFTFLTIRYSVSCRLFVCILYQVGKVFLCYNILRVYVMNES